MLYMFCDFAASLQKLSLLRSICWKHAEAWRRNTCRTGGRADLAHAQVVPVRVGQKLRQVVELGDELLHVAAAAQAVAPGGAHAAEQAVRVVEAPALSGSRGMANT